MQAFELKSNYISALSCLLVSALLSVKSYADDSTRLNAPLSHTTMQQVTRVVVDNRCFYIQTDVMWAEGQKIPESPKEATARPNCPAGFAAMGPGGAVAGGQTYLVVAGSPWTYALHSTGTGFAVLCCPIVTQWVPKNQIPH